MVTFMMIFSIESWGQRAKKHYPPCNYERNQEIGTWKIISDGKVINKGVLNFGDEDKLDDDLWDECENDRLWFEPCDFETADRFIDQFYSYKFDRVTIVFDVAVTVTPPDPDAFIGVVKHKFRFDNAEKQYQYLSTEGCEE